MTTQEYLVRKRKKNLCYCLFSGCTWRTGCEWSLSRPSARTAHRNPAKSPRIVKSSKDWAQISSGLALGQETHCKWQKTTHWGTGNSRFRDRETNDHGQAGRSVEVQASRCQAEAHLGLQHRSPKSTNHVTIRLRHFLKCERSKVQTTVQFVLSSSQCQAFELNLNSRLVTKCKRCQFISFTHFRDSL